MTTFIKLSEPKDLSEFSLIIPSVSVGNVPQLTVDLLISSNNFEKIGTIWHPAIIPSVGGDAYGTDSSVICTACELYAQEDLKIAVLQIRSGIETKLAHRFFDALKEFIVESHFKNVVILVSTFAHERHTISSSLFRFISNEEVSDVLESLGVSAMKKEESDEYNLHGGGYGIKLYEVLTVTSDIKCTVLIKYVSEGDNRPDALSVLELLYKFIVNLQNVSTQTVVWPSSWQYVFGNPAPVGMY